MSAPDPRDQLIAWAYRHLWMHAGIPSEDNPQMVAFPSICIEFFQAAERVVPGVQNLAETTPFHADQIGETVQ